MQLVSYAQLARSIDELAATCDQKSSQRQLVNSVFPKLAVYNYVDPSVAPSLLMEQHHRRDARKPCDHGWSHAGTRPWVLRQFNGQAIQEIVNLGVCVAR